jgi:hypothetical protein
MKLNLLFSCIPSLTERSFSTLCSYIKRQLIMLGVDYRCVSLSLWLYSPCGSWPLFSFLIYTQSVGLLGRGISPSQGRYLHRTTQTQNKRTQTSMFRVWFEPTIPVLERAKTVHAVDCTATVIGTDMYTFIILSVVVLRGCYLVNMQVFLGTEIILK